MQTIIQSGKTTLLVRLQQTMNGVITDPVDLTGITQIRTCFQNADGTELMLTYTGGAVAIIGNPILGKLSISLTSAQTALLALVDAGTLQISLVYGSADPIPIQISQAYSVVQSQC